LVAADSTGVEADSRGASTQIPHNAKITSYRCQTQRHREPRLRDSRATRGSIPNADRTYEAKQRNKLKREGRKRLKHQTE